MNPLTRSSYQCEVRAENDDKGAYITGRPIVFNSRTNIGPYDEIIERGALDKTDLKDVRFLVNHDTSKIPLARSRNNNKNSTMQLSVDDNGMAIRELIWMSRIMPKQEVYIRPFSAVISQVCHSCLELTMRNGRISKANIRLVTFAR